MLLTKKFKEKNRRYVLETFSKCNDYEHQNTQFFHIIEISKSMELNKCIQICFYENVHLNVSQDFSKFDGSRKIKV